MGSIVSANIYRNDDKPLYRRGNRALIIINVLSIFLFLFTKAYYVWKNKVRDKKWTAMTPEVSLERGEKNKQSCANDEQERIRYTKTTTDTGSRRLDFRFAH